MLPNIPEEVINHLRGLTGLVSTCVLTGNVMEEYAACLAEMRVWCVTNGFTKIEWRVEHAQLVEHGRDAALAHALNPNPAASAKSYDWCLQIDADATFAPDTLFRMLHTAYVSVPDSDILGAYSQLKGAPYLPTIDTGTGTWEAHFPGEGVLPVIRTGAHCILIKTPILRRFGPPWFRTRLAFRPVDALREVDNYARIKCDGRNPLTENPAWETLLSAAKKDAGGIESAVGEDSGFADSVKAAGGMIYVDTDIITGHVAKRNITPDLLKEAMDAKERRLRAAVGITR